MDLGRIGVFCHELRFVDRGQGQEAILELEELGYSAFFIPGGPTPESDILNKIADLLGGSNTIVGIAAVQNVWVRTPVDIARNHSEVTRAYPGRFVLGIGASHANFVVPRGQSYAHPLTEVRRFLDGLDGAEIPVPVGERMLGALGPRMLALARDRSAGSIPYLFNPEHTGWAREILGPGPVLAPEMAVLIETDPDVARPIARRYLSRYLDRLNYTNTLRRQGMTDDDFSDGGSDRLLDAVVAWGDPDAIKRRTQAHFDAGADHVSIQVLTRDDRLDNLSLDSWRELAPVLIDRA